MKARTRTEKKAAPDPKRILIVDDHPFLRMGLAESLSGEFGLSVCGAVGTAEAAMTAIEKLHPDVVVADLNLPGKSGLELIKDIMAMRPGLPVVVLSMHDEAVYAERCLRAGGRGYVMKNEGPEKLVSAIWQALDGGIHVSAKTSSRILERFAGRRGPEERSPLSRFTDREFEVFQWIGRGLSTQEIAARMHISPKTVETHRMRVKTKLRLATLTELIAYAARWVEADG